MTYKQHLPSELILFITAQCPLRCKHCFNWRNLQRNSDLSLPEIEALAKSLPTLNSLMISGGEPFLRKDLVEICQAFARHSAVGSIDIPTSGTLVARTVAAVREILAIEPAVQLSIGISFDGMEAYHDANRGVPGTFAKAAQCCSQLLELKKESKRLSVNILTTLVEGNKEELLALKEFAAQQFPTLDNLYWGLARGEAKERGLCSLSADDVLAIDRAFLEFDSARKRAAGGKFKNAFYALRRKAFVHKEQPVPCLAGRSIAVVYDDGSVAPCELLPAVGNLREQPFEALWCGAEMGRARQEIAQGRCSCTHECFLYPSFEQFLVNRPLSFLKLKGLPGIAELLYQRYALLRSLAAMVKQVSRQHDGGKKAP